MLGASHYLPLPLVVAIVQLDLPLLVLQLSHELYDANSQYRSETGEIRLGQVFLTIGRAMRPLLSINSLCFSSLCILFPCIVLKPFRMRSSAITPGTRSMFDKSAHEHRSIHIIRLSANSTLLTFLQNLLICLRRLVTELLQHSELMTFGHLQVSLPSDHLSHFLNRSVLKASIRKFTGRFRE